MPIWLVLLVYTNSRERRSISPLPRRQRQKAQYRNVLLWTRGLISLTKLMGKWLILIKMSKKNKQQKKTRSYSR